MDEELLQYLEMLKARDLETRNKLNDEGRLYGDYHPDMQEVHRKNAYALQKIIASHGWPGLSKVGIEGASAAWLIAQHAICTPELQRRFLICLTEAAEKGDAPMRQVAFLSDRIRFNEGKRQVYGTVLDWNENGELTCELENPGMADELREAVGLPPYEQALQEQRMAVEAEGGRAPENYDAYRQAASEWAERVGWR